MFAIVKTSEGWAVRNTETGLLASEPMLLLADAQVDLKALEAQACGCYPVYHDGQLLDVVECDECHTRRWQQPLIEMGGYRHDG